MDKTIAAFGFGGIGLLVLAFLLIPANAGREMSIPPTGAFAGIFTNGSWYYAPRYDSIITMPTGMFNVTSISNGANVGISRMPYAQISDLTTQACAAAGAASDITLDQNDEVYRITHSTSANTHQITIQQSGIYQIISTPQVGEAAVQASGTHNIWMMKNGVQVANTNIKTTVAILQAGSQTMTGVINWVGKLNQNDIVSFQQSCDDPHIGIIFTSVATPPATPSIIISIAQIGW